VQGQTIRFFCLALAALLSGCRSTRPAPIPIDVDLTDVPEALHAGYQAMARQGARNYVLNQIEIGLDALQLCELRIAGRAFDAALDAIESTYAEDAAAKRARSKFKSESEKTFRGEPYERVMAYYYRGILFILEDDLENARACFRGGMRHDAFVEDEQHRNDFASLLYLEAWCSLRLGQADTAADSLRFLRELKPDAPVPAADHNLLVIAETGHSPRKVGVGANRSELTYERGASSKAPRVTIGSRAQTLHELEDVYWQASTRGGRPVDRVLAGKVQFKDNMDGTGKALGALGTGVLTHSQTMKNRRKRQQVELASAGVMVLGALFSSVGDSVKPEADLRRWRNLPDRLYLTSLASDAEVKLPKAANSASCRSAAASGTRLIWLRTPQHLCSGP
jgi:tetratricopeptide (TPR) repeat protein